MNNEIKFRVLDVQWHIGHQYEMLKFPFVEWSWLLHYKRQQYSKALRGSLDHMFKYVHAYEPGCYDAAILHLDQDCLDPVLWNYGKGVVYRDMNEVIDDIPKIVIMHGTPFRPEAAYPYSEPEWLVETLHRVLGNNTLVVNSHEAQRQWQKGTTIVHGMDASEWFDLPKFPRVVTTLSSGGMSAYYDRAFLADVKSELRKRDISLCHIGDDFHPGSWDEYRSMLGGSLVYFNPTRESPMPRARTEAMLSGACVITTPYHDADTFIDHGVDGYLIDRDAHGVANLIEYLIHNPHQAISVGQAGKRRAQRIFSSERYASDWLKLLYAATGKTLGNSEKAK